MSDAPTIPLVRCGRCAADVPRDGNQCAKCGAFIAGNEANLRHGLRRFDATGAVPDDLRQSVEEFRDQLVSDQGGTAEMTAIRAGLCRQLTHAEAGTRLCMKVLLEKGITTRQGRAAYDRLLSTMDRYVRISQALGIERRARAVSFHERLAEALARTPPQDTEVQP